MSRHARIIRGRRCCAGRPDALESAPLHAIHVQQTLVFGVQHGPLSQYVFPGGVSWMEYVVRSPEVFGLTVFRQRSAGTAMCRIYQVGLFLQC